MDRAKKSVALRAIKIQATAKYKLRKLECLHLVTTKPEHPHLISVCTHITKNTVSMRLEKKRECKRECL